MTGVLLTTVLIAVAVFTVLWVVSLLVNDASIVDPFWGPAFAITAWVAFSSADDPGVRGLLTAVLVTIWALRLGLHLAVRNLGKGEDYRYQAMRRHWGDRFPIVSLGTVFLLQAALMWIVSLPVQVAMVDGGAPGIVAFVGVALWAIGLFFEAIGDWQLVRFKRDPENKGTVMDRGLWRFTRHPNYFGDFTVWWGLFLLSITGLGRLWIVVGPLLMSWLLLRVSGVAMLEKTISKRRPGYEEYARRTNAFFPWFPKGA